MRTHLTLLLLIGTSAASMAQQAPPPVEVRDLRAVPRDIAEEVQQVFNAASSRRVSGDLTVSAADVVTGDVAVMSGQVVVAGQVTGRLVAVQLWVQRDRIRNMFSWTRRRIGWWYVTRATMSVGTGAVWLHVRAHGVTCDW